MNIESKLKKVLDKGDFAVTAECGPPKGADPDVVKSKGKILNGYVDSINVTDNQTAVVRLCSLAAGALLKAEGLDPVFQVVTRDRNRIALQSDVLGASALGIRNILCLTGDHQSFGNQPEAKGVFDIDSIQSQCIFNLNRFRKWIGLVKDQGVDNKVYILGGITPLKSARMAEYMVKHVAGMDVPEEIISRMKSVPAKEQRREGVRIAVETIHALREMDGVHGIHIMAIEWGESVPP